MLSQELDNKMPTLEEYASDNVIKQEYRKTLLLNMFRKIVSKMNQDTVFKQHVHKLYLQSTDIVVTTRVLFEKHFQFKLFDSEVSVVASWMNAYFTKSNVRKRIPNTLVSQLIASQDGKCAICGEPLGANMKAVHVDHIVPFALVGDELDNNYQCLCSTCNQSKSAHIDYIFKSLIKLI